MASRTRRVPGLVAAGGLALVAATVAACGPAVAPTPAALPSGLDPGHVLVRVDRSPVMAPYDIVTPRLFTLTADGRLVTQDETADRLMPPHRQARLAPA